MQGNKECAQKLEKGDPDLLVYSKTFYLVDNELDVHYYSMIKAEFEVLKKQLKIP